MKTFKDGVIEWVLRIGVSGTFLGHGCLALLVNPPWIILITTVGFSAEMATKMLPIIGVLDIIIAIVVLLKPYKGILYWAIFWTFITALSRFIAHQGMLEFIERFSNIACPTALLFYIITKKE